MANEIVKLSNQFNNQALRKFNAVHLDLLMAICSRVKEQGTNEVIFTFDDLRKLTKLNKNLTNAELTEQIVEVNKRLLALNFMFEDEEKVIQFALFTRFITDKKEATLNVAVNQEFAFLLNDLTSEFTRFELEQFADLKSSYAKECYRRLKQYRQTGMWHVSVSDFRRLLDVPKSYQTRDLNKRVITPILDELHPLMHLTLERRYKKTSNGRGRGKLDSFIWRFDREYTPEQAQVIDRKAKERREREERAARFAEERKSKFDIAEYMAEHEGRTPWKQAQWECEQESE